MPLVACPRPGCRGVLGYWLSPAPAGAEHWQAELVGRSCADRHSLTEADAHTAQVQALAHAAGHAATRTTEDDDKDLDLLLDVEVYCDS